MRVQTMRYDNKAWRRWVVAGFALVALSLIACGGSDSDATASRDDSSMAFTEPGVATGGGSAPSAGAQMGADGDFAGEKTESASNGAVMPGETGAPAPIADVLGRQVIRNGSVDLIVESVDEAFEQVRGVVEQAGGYLASSSFSGRDEFQRARMTVRIPAEKFDQVIADLRNLAIEVDSVSTSSQDVTEEFTDLQASLRNLRAIETQYLTLLGEADNIGDILQVQDRLNGVRYELERVQGRLNLLENQTSLATLEIALFPESAPMTEEEPTGFRADVEEAWESSVDFVSAAGTAIVVALVWSWWLIPFVVIGALIARRYLGRLPARSPRDARDTDTSDDAPRVDTPGGAA
ncbi:MAG: DUF4349 domain-containing protein [Chloroflexi bacterium]|nr:DUF4349 domain-containing protein [Chloroflexota bacterium]